MLGIVADFQIQGDAASIQKFRELQAGDFSRPLAMAGELIVRTVQKRMSEGKQPDGSPQKPLSYITKILRRKGKKSGKEPIPLVDTGRMRNSVTKNVIGKDQLEVGTNVEYGKLHQFGGPSQITVIRKKNKKITKGKSKGKFKKRDFATAYIKTIMVPARPWLGYGSAEEQILIKIFTDYYKF